MLFQKIATLNFERNSFSALNLVMKKNPGCPGF